jgi:hypothetical protein
MCIVFVLSSITFRNFALVKKTHKAYANLAASHVHGASLLPYALVATRPIREDLFEFPFHDDPLPCILWTIIYQS